MKTAEFTESSYAFAMTNNILRSGMPLWSGAPIFPTLRDEGTLGGYDVEIPARPISLFLQFKVPQVVRRASINIPPRFKLPYLRMHLRTIDPNQHQLLLDWEKRQPNTYYVTPDFWENAELNRHFASKCVHEKSWYVSPSQIGVLDDNPHHIAYQPGLQDAWLHSEPKKLEGDFGYEVLTEKLRRAAEVAPIKSPSQFLHELASDLEKVTHYPLELEVRARTDFNLKSTLERPEALRTLLRILAELIQIRLGCTLAVLGNN